MSTRNENKLRQQIADAIHGELCGQCRPDLGREQFTREDADHAADAVMPIVGRVLSLADELTGGTLGELASDQVAYLIRVAVFDSAKAGVGR